MSEKRKKGSKPKPERELTQKQESFCLAYVESGNASAAYRCSYNSAKMKNETVRVKASELLANGNVTVRIAELRKLAEGKALLTLEGHMAELASLRDKAKAAGQFGPAIKSEELRGRLSGLYAEQPQPAASSQSQVSQAVAALLVKEDALAPMFERFCGGLKTIEHQPAKSASGNGHDNGGNGRGDNGKGNGS